MPSRQAQPTAVDARSGQRAAQHEALSDEQAHLDRVYRRLDALREHARARLSQALVPAAGPHAAAVDRDALAAAQRGAVLRYDAVEHDLCFGRLDTDGGDLLHIGRIGLREVAGEQEQEQEQEQVLLVDWRAPAARPFYTATAVAPEGVRRRRAIATRDRRVTSVDDELLTGGAAGSVVGEAALLEALRAPRTGRMRDIVRTIQAEQDAVIRAPMGGVLVVEGGPGTGKTAVALHRAAYLMFTHRELLTRRGVLLVGPSPVFLRYISHVLPSLAESGVLAATVGELFPGAVADRPETLEVAELKGRAGMTAVIEAAVADRQQVPPGGVEVVLDGEPLLLTESDIARIRERVQAAGVQHNPARRLVVRVVAALLARRLATRIGHDPYGFDPLGEDDAPGTDVLFSTDEIADQARQLRRDPRVHTAVDRIWPLLTPQRLLADLWASPARITAAAPGLTADERALLHRRPRPGDVASGLATGWSEADVPLLDEAAELLGDDGSAAARAAADRRARQEELAYAEGVLQIAAGSAPLDLEAGEAVLQVTDVLDAAALAGRHGDADLRTAAERAAEDRTWTFGHVVVDEAQEVSPMAWRLLMRRCPTRSMTVVGDPAQGVVRSGRSWSDLFAPHVGDRWRRVALTVSYRTPREVMDVAAGVLRRIDPGAQPPHAVRDGGERPWVRRVAPSGVVATVAEAVRAEQDRPDGGTVAVVLPAGPEGGALAAGLAAALPEASRRRDPDLDAPVVLLTARQVKGLEFDAVVVVEPALVAAAPGGLADLYVALTRPTRALGVVHSDPLPDGLSLPVTSPDEK